MTPEQANVALASFFTPQGAWINPNINIASVRCPIVDCNEVFLRVSDETALPPVARAANVRAKEATVVPELIAHLQVVHINNTLIVLRCPIKDGDSIGELLTDTFDPLPPDSPPALISGHKFVDADGKPLGNPKPINLVPSLIVHLATHQVNKW